ncbi:MAG: Methyltransferase type 11 [Parcubacteria group bacterium]|nr:Methyltransferase type 11 [Parcubacteria group bacterium]
MGLEQEGSSLENLYRTHHAQKRGEGFVLLGAIRGDFLKSNIGVGKQVLDIGCRDGALTRSYAHGNTVTGLDIDNQALTQAKNELGIQVKHVDLNGDWGVPPASFDFVVAAEVVEHLYYPDAVMEKVARVLKPGGVLLGTVPNAFSLKNRIRLFLLKKKHTPLGDPTHINHFVVKELEEVLKNHFKKVTVTGAGRFTFLARTFPQLFAFDLMFRAEDPRTK